MISPSSSENSMAMDAALKGKKVVLVVASEGYQPIEYGVTKDVLEEAGIEVITASDKPGGAVATDNSTTPVDISLDDLDVSKYDGLFLIGGSGAMEKLDNSHVYKLMNEVRKRNMPYGAICISARILAKAGVIDNQQATGWNGDNALPAIFNAHNVTLIDRDVVIHKLLVTATGPAAAEKFGKGIIRALRKATLSDPGEADGAVYFEVE